MCLINSPFVLWLYLLQYDVVLLIRMQMVCSTTMLDLRASTLGDCPI